MGTVEDEIRAQGEEVFRLMGSGTPSVFDRKRWSGKLMELAMSDPGLKVRLFRFVDVLPTLATPEQIVAHIREYFLDEENSVPPLLKRLLAGISGPTAAIAAALVRRNIISFSRTFIAGDTTEVALPVLEKLWRDRHGVSVDILGEAALSEKEAREYLDLYLELIATLARQISEWPVHNAAWERRFPRLNISVKVSSLFSRIGPVNYEESVAMVKDRLRPILRSAREAGGFVNLDMETYSLKNITLDIFTELLDEDEFRDWEGMGIALQAYLKETWDDLQHLIGRAGSRGRRITVRLVKGAYWEYETVTARQKGWPAPVFGTKAHTDWNFERCAELMLANSSIVTPAIATHNVRSLAAAMIAARRHGVAAHDFEFQMLFGMAEPVKRAVSRMGYAIREYAPVGALIPGMAYLVRRLLENTSNEGFLRRIFVDNAGQGLLLGAPEAPPNETALLIRHELNTTAVRAEPVEAQESIHISTSSMRTDSWIKRTGSIVEIAPSETGPATPEGIAPFANEPLLDFSQSECRARCRAAIEKVRGGLGQRYPAVIGGRKKEGESTIVSVNPARPSEVIGEVAAVGRNDVEEALAAARNAQREWGAKSPGERAAFLFRAAEIARGKRTELLAWQVFETGKSWAEADADVAEAIDYFEYYGREMLRLGTPLKVGDAPGEDNRYFYQPRGVALVIAPWNFPLAISAGMTAAALVAGNAVLYKPSSLSPVNGWQLFALLQEAGIPDGVVNFIPGSGEAVGGWLAEHPEIDLIAFTGSREVGLGLVERAARRAPGARSVKRVIAEMGGKNAVIVDADADLDQAVAGILQSAFSYQGQKCSACSRVIVLAGCYERFLERLTEAVKGVRVGPPEDPACFMGPLIEPKARERVERYAALAAAEGRIAVRGDAPMEGCYVAPVVVTDLPSSSSLLRDEIFGPLLAVIKAKDMNDALAIANDSDYALTGGLFSRSPSNIQQVAREFAVGNLYINRGITGAIVGRQPFGGFRMSGVGSKAGGPDYLLQFLEPRVVTENTMRRGFAPDVLS
jgi:RHH-type proline utilization regulon transcriptional repressor/proline dehydrogenase/delta 1-pyrroline-5-carboxylate dehydrogenase